VTEPDKGDRFDTGERMTIEWDTDDAPYNSSVRLDLYTSGGRYVSTIATVSERDSDFRWTIPGRGRYCTLQYPNQLCGTNLSGSYTVRATLLAPGGYTLDSDQSGTFRIKQERGGEVDEFSARPTSGREPLRVTFTIVAEEGEYTLDFDDGDEEDIEIRDIYCFAYPCFQSPVYVTHVFRDRDTFNVILRNEDNDIVGRERIIVR
jgi:hypothetical protein